MKEGEGIKQNNIYNTDTDSSVVVSGRGKGGVGRQRWAEEGKWGRKRLAWGDRCTVQCSDDVLLSFTLETCMIL